MPRTPRLASGVTAILFDAPQRRLGRHPRRRARHARHRPARPGDDRHRHRCRRARRAGRPSVSTPPAGVAAICASRAAACRSAASSSRSRCRPSSFDLLNGGDKDWGRMPPYWELGWQAHGAAPAAPSRSAPSAAATAPPPPTSRAGLARPARSRRRASRRRHRRRQRRRARAVVGDGPHFWAAPYEVGASSAVSAARARSRRRARAAHQGPRPASTTIALVATDAVLTKAQAKRLAIMADDGLARAIRPAHAPMDGDTVFAVATLRKPLASATYDLTEIGARGGRLPRPRRRPRRLRGDGAALSRRAAGLAGPLSRRETAHEPGADGGGRLLAAGAARAARLAAAARAPGQGLPVERRRLERQRLRPAPLRPILQRDLHRS